MADKIAQKDLKTELTRPSQTGLRSVWQWRPLASLTAAAVADILRRAAMGDARDFLIAAADIREKDLHYAAVLQTRTLAVTDLPIDIQPWDDSAPARRAAEYGRRLEAGQIKPEAPQEPLVEWTNPRTGEVRLIPWAIDPGFAYNVGEASLRWRALLDLVADKAEGWAAPMAATALANLAASPTFARWYDNPRGAWPLARLPDADAKTLGAQEGVRVARMSEGTAVKQRQRHPELRPEDYARAQAIIDGATAKAETVNPQTGTRSMIYVREDERYVLVVKATLDGQRLYVTSLYRLHADQARRDLEIARLLRKGKKQ
ncbi:MAG: DUF935 domain-containing protein [Tepidimonas sp.]|nr:DUF935 domain-containing protein [Tepidimonas sp.]